MTDPDAELAVLGALLLDASLIPLVRAILPPEAMSRATHRALYLGILALAAVGRPCDPVTLGAELAAQGDGRGQEALGLIPSAVDAVVVPAHAPVHAQIIRDRWIRRQLIAQGKQLEVAASDLTVPVEVAVRLTVDHLVRATYTQPTPATADVAADLIAIQERLEHQSLMGYEPTGVGTGLRDLDDLTDGWQPDTLNIVAARPSVGKSAFALQCVRPAAEAGVPVYFASAEMSRHELLTRVVSMVSGVELRQIRARNQLEFSTPKITAAMGEIRGWPVCWDATPASPVDIRFGAERFQAEMGRPLGLLVVDYLQLLRPDEKRENRNLEVGSITKALRRIAKDLHVPVLCLAQVSRKVNQDSGKVRRPQLSDLRDSGEIEQDADLVVFLHRESDQPEDEAFRQREIIVAKQRNGPTGSCTVVFDPSVQRWTGRSRYAA